MATLHKTDDAKQMMRSDPDGQMQQSKTIFCIKPRLATYPQCKQVPKQQVIIKCTKSTEIMKKVPSLCCFPVWSSDRWKVLRCKSQPFPRWDGRVWSHPCHLGTDWTQPFLGCPVHTPHEFCERGVPMLGWDQ